MSERQNKVAFHNLGCKVNAYETDAMMQAFREQGFTEVSFEEYADIYIVNTCSVTNIADRKSRQMLHRAKKVNPQGFVVAVGCYVQAAAAEVEKDAGIDLAIGNNHKGQIVSMVLEAYEKKMEMKQSACPQTADSPLMNVTQIGSEKEFDSQFLTQIDSHTRAFIKVQDGCNQFCSYCIIPYVRGRIRSRIPQEVVEEVSQLVQKGIREIVLTGIHLSSYGLDFEKEKRSEKILIEGEEKQLSDLRLLDLIRLMAEIPGIERIRLGSLEPRIVTKEFAQALSKYQKVCPHFHLSLQSGCDETLKRMNRRYNTNEYEQACNCLREWFMEPAITTDVIVGFPGETEEEFAKTKAYLEKLALYEMHIFKYSVRKGTVAEKMPCQLPEQVKAQRSDILIELEATLSEAYRQKVLGKECEWVLVEEKTTIQEKEYYVGYTTRYVRMAIPKEEFEADPENQIVAVKPISMLTSEVLLARLL